jgi:hypothetical protein
MKSRNLTFTASVILKVTGIVLILLYLLDCATLLFSAKFQESAWMLEFTSRVVDRGFIPMMGLGFLFAGFAFEGDTAASEAGDGSKGLKLTALLIACALALGFLLVIPLHVSTTSTAKETELKRIADEAIRSEAQISAQVQQVSVQLDAQLAGLEQAIKSGQVPEAQLAQAKQQMDQLKKLKADPKALEAKIAPERDKKLSEIRDSRQKAETQIQENALRSGMRVGLGGALLAISYAIIGWTGLRRML